MNISTISCHTFNFWLAASDDKINPDDNKRDTQPLSHVEGHGVFELHLWLFYELDENPWAENNGAEEPEEESRVFDDSVFFEEKIHQYRENDEAD